MSINTTRALVGGTVAGAVRVVGHDVLDAMFFTGPLPPVSTVLVFTGLQLVTGIATVYLYAVIRPRVGGAGRAAITVGVLTWAMSALAWYLTVAIGSVSLTVYATRVFASLPIALISAVVGASLYRETVALVETAAGVRAAASIRQ